MTMAICDDEKEWREKAGKILRQRAAIAAIEMEIIYFRGREELLNYKGAPIDTIFMDVDLDDGSGIQTAEEVNKKWPECQIVFLTNYLYYATEVYSARHAFFVLKEQFAKRLPEVLVKIRHESEQQGSKLIFNLIGKTTLNLRPADIYYFERVGRVTKIVTVWGSYEIWDKLTDIMEGLSDIDFARCHNSYIVYLPAVRALEQNDFVMYNGDRIQISRKYASLVKKEFMNWALMKMA